MISGAHLIIYSADPEADRAFFREVLGFPAVDAGQGGYLMCDDVAATIQTLERQKVKCDPVADLGWGLLTNLSLPGGGRLGLYQPRHPVAARKDGAEPAPSRNSVL